MEKFELLSEKELLEISGGELSWYNLGYTCGRLYGAFTNAVEEAYDFVKGAAK